MSHTPGPWELHEVGDKCKHFCPAKEDLSILTVALEYSSEDGEPTYFGAVHNPCDAHLISAAPELLNLVQELAYMFQDHPKLNHKRIAQIIAKATGGPA